MGEYTHQGGRVSQLSQRLDRLDPTLPSTLPKADPSPSSPGSDGGFNRTASRRTTNLDRARSMSSTVGIFVSSGESLGRSVPEAARSDAAGGDVGPNPGFATNACQDRGLRSTTASALRASFMPPAGNKARQRMLAHSDSADMHSGLFGVGGREGGEGLCVWGGVT